MLHSIRMVKLTLRVGKESQQCNAIAMWTLDIVMNISYQDIYWPVFVLACCDGDHCFVTPKNYWDKHWSVSSFFLSNYILCSSYRSAKWNISSIKLNCLIPAPISGHKVFIPMVVVLITSPKWCIVEAPIEVGVGEQIVNNSEWVAEPHSEVLHLPWWRVCTLLALIIKIEMVPRCIT